MFDDKYSSEKIFVLHHFNCSKNNNVSDLIFGYERYSTAFHTSFIHITIHLKAQQNQKDTSNINNEIGKREREQLTH